MKMTYSSNYMSFFFFFNLLATHQFSSCCRLYDKKKITMIDDIFWVYWSDLKKKHGITEFSWLINLAVNS